MAWETGYVWVEGELYVNWLLYFYKGVLIKALRSNWPGAPDPPSPFPTANVKPQPTETVLLVGTNSEELAFYKGILLLDKDTPPTTKPQLRFTGTKDMRVHTDTSTWEDVEMTFEDGVFTGSPKLEYSATADPIGL